MNERAIVTFGIGEHAALLDIARPSLQAFAKRHEYDYFEAQQIGHQRPAPWYKVQCLLDVLRTYDIAVFIGCDMVIVDGREPLPHGSWDWWQELVVHNTPQCGRVPNDDLWVCNRSMIPWLEKIWTMTQHLQHGWWEQAALCELMSFDPDVTRFPTYCRDVDNELYRHTRHLPHEWNVHIWDQPQPAHPRIQHATMWPDRVKIMTQWAKEAEGWINE